MNLMQNLFQPIINNINAVIGKNQEMDQLLKARDIRRIIAQMDNRDSLALAALKEYRIEQHMVMKREDKPIYDENGNFERWEKRWKIPIPYQVYINEIALVFLYGRPVQWNQKTEGTDRAFEAFKQMLEDTHFDSKIRQCKRIAGSETQSAMLFRVYRDRDGNPAVQIRVLAKSKGDEIYYRKDQYENIVDAGWGYYLKENNKTVYHYDHFTRDIIYHCKYANSGWNVEIEENFIGKIPLILFWQAKEWDGVEFMIDRSEFIVSKDADVNDYFADPIAMMNADAIVNMPKKKEEAKMLIVKNGTNINDAAKYLTWDNASESKKNELDRLDKHILSKSFTPKIDFEVMSGLSNVSAKALKQMMTLADIKASKHKEYHDDMLDRIASLGIAIIGNVLNVSLKNECSRLKIGHEFQEPFGEDIKEALDMLIATKDAGGLSTESFVELNPQIKNKKRELERISNEREQRMQEQNDLFGQAE